MVSSEVTLQILATLSGAALVSLVLFAVINATDRQKIPKPGESSSASLAAVVPWANAVNVKTSSSGPMMMSSHRKRSPTVQPQPVMTDSPNRLEVPDLQGTLLRTTTEADSEGVNVWQLFSGKFAHLKPSHLRAENSTESPRHTEKTTMRQLHWEEEERHHIRHGHHKGLRRGNRPVTSPPPFPSCYTGNEVLAIVGLTCLLNFAFVLLVMASVHYCSSSPKSDQIPRLDSVVIESETESDDSRRCWDSRSSLLSLHHLPLYKHKTPSHSMEQLLFVD